MEHFRQITNIEEMKTIIGKSADKDLGIIWQTARNERMIWPISSLDIQDQALVIKTSNNLSINQAFPLYIKINNRDFVFRLALGEYELGLKQIACKYPKEAKALESRDQMRTKMPSKTNVQLTLRAVNASTMLDTKIQLMDISEGGLGALVSRINQDFFLRSNIFQIVKVGDRPFVEPAAVVLKHITEQGKGNKLRLGFCLEKPLSDGFIQLLKGEMRKKVTTR